MSSLFEQHKAERRARIGAVARELVAERGYAGLTMRDLARAARVSVPTLYNLFGSKDAILGAELQAMAGELAAAMPSEAEGFLARGLAMFDTGMRLIEREPEFFRATIQMFMTSPETGEMRQRTEDAFVGVIAANLAAAQRAGQLEDWADPMLVARHIHANYTAAFLAWGFGNIDFATFRAAAASGACHLLVGVARGRYREDVLALLRTLQPALRALTKENDHAAKSGG
ncbi:MAG TPA: helix-turn-helix domain-containing protein [Kofleriaceae bacterium]|nr:helix-turn-helix domain-containing protein [Kofleriaceae bacterium]